MQSTEEQNPQRRRQKNRLAKARKFKPQHLKLDISEVETEGSRM